MVVFTAIHLEINSVPSAQKNSEGWQKTRLLQVSEGLCPSNLWSAWMAGLSLSALAPATKREGL